MLVDSPLPQLDRLLDYRIPEGMGGVAPGVRVAVPLRTASRVTEGFVVELVSQQDFPGPLSDIVSLVSPVPVLQPEVWALARAVSDRAAGSASDVLRLAIPPRHVRVEKAWLARAVSETREPIEAPELEGYPDGVVEAAIADRERLALGVAPGVAELDAGVWVGRWATTLARLAARTISAGESAILVAPDYRDQEQLAAALAALLPADAIVRLDARQSNPDRYRGLLRALDHHPMVLLGNRSVVYAPAAQLGLIAVWNDGDPLLGEPLAPYVHARDAALIRQDQQQTALVFAAHTRSTEVQRLVEIGHLRELALARPRHPRVIPTANIPAQDHFAAQARIPSIAWREATAASKVGPVLVQVARPGYAPGMRCADCGTSARCRVCDGPLHQQRQGGILTCRWCGAPEASWRCQNCESTRLLAAGAGATRTAEELGRAFPGVRVIVADGERTVQAIDERPAIVVATRGAEPIAAGGYRAVILLDGDRMVARESLRVGEDCLRWWSDAAALAADDAPVVLVGVGGALASALVTGRQADYARAELVDRRALRFPPAVRVATLRGLPEAVAAALLTLPEGVDPVGTTDADGSTRAILRFDYVIGPAVARAVRSEIIRQATTRRKPVPGAPPRRGRQALPLRAHFDDPEPFGECAEALARVSTVQNRRVPPLRIIFAGSPAAAVPSLRRLLASQHEVAAVVTREDAPLGRKKVTTATPIAREAESAGIPIIRANRLAPVTNALLDLGADLGVIVAYGGLIREPLLSGPRLGWINLHFSLLPRWRGAAPVQRALIAGDEETGASVFQLVPELDAGDIFASVRQPVGAHETAGHLLARLSVSGAELLREVVDALADGSARATPQIGAVTLAPKLTLADGRLDWSETAEQVDNRFRGTTPEPGAFTQLGEERIKILDALIAHGVPPLRPGRVESRGGRLLVGTASEPLELLSVQPAGRRPMPSADWWRGRAPGAPEVAS